MSDRKLLTRDEILGAQDIQTERVPVPEWGGEVIVRSMSGSERDAWETSLFVEQRASDGTLQRRESNFSNLRARLIAVTLVDEQGHLGSAGDDCGWGCRAFGLDCRCRGAD